ncbi:hypothetical protein EG830_15815, partial [bacterium]|nr:hypothetical protein [bacterium]
MAATEGTDSATATNSAAATGTASGTKSAAATNPAAGTDSAAATSTAAGTKPPEDRTATVIGATGLIGGHL